MINFAEMTKWRYFPFLVSGFSMSIFDYWRVIVSLDGFTSGQPNLWPRKDKLTGTPGTLALHLRGIDLPPQAATSKAAP